MNLMLSFLIFFTVMAEISYSALDPDDPLLLHFIDEIETMRFDMEEVNILRSVNLSHASEKLNAMIDDLERKLPEKVNFTLTTEIWQVLKKYSTPLPPKPPSNSISKNLKFILKELQNAFDRTLSDLNRFEALNEYGTRDYLINLNKNEEQILVSIKKDNVSLYSYTLIKEFYILRNKTEQEVIQNLFKVENLLITLTDTTKAALKIFRAAKKKGHGEIPMDNWYENWKIIKEEVKNLNHRNVFLYQNYFQSLYTDEILIKIIYKIANVIDPATPSVHLQVALNGENKE